VKTGLLAMLLLTFTAASAAAQAQLDELIARAKSFELDTPYVPPAGDPLAYYAAGYAKIMCSAVFMTGVAIAANVQSMARARNEFRSSSVSVSTAHLVHSRANWRYWLEVV
jgi:hypothetical protein